MNNPLVSVIIPTYKRANFLKLTLQSVADQSYKNVEIIVVDDGSPTDEAEQVCAAYERVTFIKIENSGGPAKPRNIGIQKATGKYLAFVDDDDIWLRTKLEKQVEILEQNPDFGLVHCYCQITDENGITKNEFVGRPGSPSVKHGDVSLRMMGNWTIMMPTPLVRNEIIQKVGFYNEEIPGTFADVEYWTRLSFITKFYYLDEILVLYRVHPFNMSSNKKVDIQLPINLKKVLKINFINKVIDRKEFELLKKSLVKSQIKMFKLDCFSNLYYLNKLDQFWFFKFSNIKLLLVIIFKR